jgi:toxin ParE1/3/4
VSRRLVVRSVAESDIAEAALWYEARAAGLGADFLRAVDVVLAEAARSSERFPVIHRRCRRALLRRFPYAVYFVADQSTVTIMACMHAHRDPQNWQHRISEAAEAAAEDEFVREAARQTLRSSER